MLLPPFFLFLLVTALFGFSLPYMARPFGKMMPCGSGTALARPFRRKPKTPKGRLASHRIKRKKLQKALRLQACLWALLSASLAAAMIYSLPETDHLFATVLLAVLLLGAAIDLRYWVLPDVLTVPLLMLGFTAAAFSDFISPADSAIGALFGYGAPTLTAAIMPGDKEGIGGGDVKMLAALGAWFGVMGLSFSLFFSFLFFLPMIAFKGSRMAPYGPALLAGAAATLFLMPVM